MQPLRRLKRAAAAAALAASIGLGAGAIAGAEAPSAGASSPYGCWYPYGWGPVRVCYQIAGYGNFVYFFQGEVDNGYWFPISIHFWIINPHGYIIFNDTVYAPAHGRAPWLDVVDGNYPTGRYCAAYAPGTRGAFLACYSVL